MATSDSLPLAYFFTGALVPTLAYLLFLWKGSELKRTYREEDEDDSSDDEFGADMSAGSARSWGIKDAPYKVRKIYRSTMVQVIISFVCLFVLVRSFLSFFPSAANTKHLAADGALRQYKSWDGKGKGSRPRLSCCGGLLQTCQKELPCGSTSLGNDGMRQNCSQMSQRG